jgi:hypothetical protein
MCWQLQRQLQRVMPVGLSADPEVGYISKVLGVYIQGASVNSSRAHERGDLRNFIDLTMLSEVPLV